MKKFLSNAILTFACITTAIFFCTSTYNISNAGGIYRRIITDDTPFYSDSAGTDMLFYLPYTYYVKVIDEGVKLTHVECYGTGNSITLDGYVPTEMLFDDNLPVPTPYMEKEITSITTTVLYQDKNLNQPLQYVFSSRNLIYYGNALSDDNTIVFYVGYNGRLGYVKETDIQPFDIALHPNELTFIVPEPELPEEPEQIEEPTEDVFTVRLIIVVCLVFAGVIGLVVAFKNKPAKATSANYYEENEYE